MEYASLKNSIVAGDKLLEEPIRAPGSSEKVRYASSRYLFVSGENLLKALEEVEYVRLFLTSRASVTRDSAT